ncbi:MAG: protein translocase subunit SecF [Ruminococcus sp.]|nr:protein translocase subunit SecF [Ruminococcus sp.]
MSTKKKIPDKPAYNGKVYNFCGQKKLILAVCVILFAALIVGVIIRGDNRSIEFKGGTMLTYTYEGDLSTSDVKSLVEDVTGQNVTVRTGKDINTGDAQFTISMTTGDFDADKQAELTTKLKEKFSENDLKDAEAVNVTSTTGKEFLLKCIIAVIFAALVIILYIAVRFRNIGGWSAGMCSVFALLNDLIAAMAVSFIFGFEFSANTVAVILTILGYSINNTIVIYDRIRENRKLMPKATLNELINTGCSQSLTRSIRTSVTTISTMLIITIVVLIKGYSSLLSFSVPLMAGLISGTFTSLFVAPVTWSWWKNREKTKKAAAK